MKVLRLPNVLLVVSVTCILLAISLSAGSLVTSVKWNLYNSKTNYGIEGDPFVQIYAYQTLWTSFDIWTGGSDSDHAQAYNVIYDGTWKILVRLLIIGSLGAEGLSLAILLIFSLIPHLNRKSLILNIGRGASSFLLISAGSTLAYALHYYKSKYSSLLCQTFYLANYPDEDNLSIGFYMASAASAFLFAAAILNVINVALYYKTAKTNATPATVYPEP